MELYLCDEQFKSYHLIDDFESLIWRDRWQGYGDFELHMPAHNYFLGSRYGYYSFIRFSESSSVMMLETVEQPRQKTPTNKIIVRGRSIEAKLLDRTNTNEDPNAVIPLTGTSASQLEYILDRYILNPTDPNNVIPGLELGFLEGGAVFTRQYKRDLIYNVINNICQADNLGWNIQYRDVGRIVFNASRGTDLSNRTVTYFKEFSGEMDTLINLSSLESMANYKNHARVEGARTVVNVFDTNDAFHNSGWNRRTLVVKASDIGTDPEVPVANDIPLLEQRGRDALKAQENSYISVVEGEVPRIQWSQMSYSLGDLIRTKDLYGRKPKVRITEDVWTIDQTGAKRIPSFTTVPEGTNE